jgi:hypothetical protein
VKGVFADGGETRDSFGEPADYPWLDPDSRHAAGADRTKIADQMNILHARASDATHDPRGTQRGDCVALRAERSIQAVHPNFNSRFILLKYRSALSMPIAITSFRNAASELEPPDADRVVDDACTERRPPRALLTSTRVFAVERAVYTCAKLNVMPCFFARSTSSFAAMDAG